MRHLLAVTLKSPDPAAVTALGALASFMPQSAPSAILRYDLWLFESEGDREAVLETVGRYPDILNPNKQRGVFLDAGLPPLPAGDLVWAGVRVEEVSSGASETWTRLLSRSPACISSVNVSVLWLLGYPAGTSRADASARAGEVSVAVDRKRGLLANPVSQRACVVEAGMPGPDGAGSEA